MAERIGAQMGHYRLTHLLGQGAFAEIYLGVHVHLGTHAALKLLTSLASPGEIEQFRREAQTIAHLVHPHIVRLLDFGLEADQPYLVMAYAPGGSLRQRHPPGVSVPLPTVHSYVQQIAPALQHAHEQQIIHRDIKPENLLLGQSSEVLLSDFGIAVMLQQTKTHVTGQGFAGSPAYAAPEQFQNQSSPASDQYALGVVVYEWLTGALPFQGAWYALAAQKVLSSPRLLREQAPTISPAVEQVVLRALAADPRARFASVQAFAAAFEQACHDEARSPAVLPARPDTAGMPSFVAQGSTWLAQATPPMTSPPAAQAFQPAQGHAPGHLSGPGGAAPGWGNAAVPVVQSTRPVGRKRKSSGLRILLVILGIIIALGLIGGVGAAFLLKGNQPRPAPCRPAPSLRCQQTPEPAEHASPSYSLNAGNGTVIVWISSRRPDLL